MAVFASRQIVLPQIVNFVNYIQSHGTEWIDTGLTANQNTRVEAVVTATETQDAGAVFGAEQTFQDRMFAIDAYGCFYGSTVYQWSSLQANVERKVEAVGNKFYLDNALVYTAATSSFQTPVTLTMFGFNVAASNSVTQLIKAKMKYLKIWQDGATLSRDFRPCLDRNGVPCMYDTVSKSYFYNQGSGTFVYG